MYGLLANALITLAQTLGTSYESLVVLRLLNGISNGLVFVLVPALSLEWLAKRARTDLSGLLYLGVAGILTTSTSSDKLTQEGNFWNSTSSSHYSLTSGLNSKQLIHSDFHSCNNRYHRLCVFGVFLMNKNGNKIGCIDDNDVFLFEAVFGIFGYK